MTSRHHRSTRAMPIHVPVPKTPVNPLNPKNLLTLPPTRPRNPLVAAALLRKAGAHQPSRGAVRAAERRSLRAELLEQTRRHRPAGDP